MKPSEIQITDGADVPSIKLTENLPPPATVAGADEHPDARVFITAPDGIVTAHAALWWKEVPPYPDHALGAIGGFAATDSESTRLLLDAACVHLSRSGCTLAVGPMNGNTWRRYRFVNESDGGQPFLLEPRNPEAYPEWWGAAGFEKLAAYSSSRMLLDGTEAVPSALRKRIERSGVILRPLDPAHYDEELGLIHELSLRCFSRNFLYTPLAKEAFLTFYQKIRQHVDPDLVQIAERGGVPCGFVFGIPDLEAAARGESPALIVKTLAVDPASRSAGLGSLLVDELHRIGRRKEFTESIHALQHETNSSLKITGRHEGHPFRRYILFSKTL